MDAKQMLIDELDLSQERLTVRGKDLNDLIGNMSFVAATYHVITGVIPSPTAERLLNRYLITALLDALTYPKLHQAISTSALLGGEIESLVMVAMLFFEGVSQQKAPILLPDDLAMLAPVAHGLYLMALLPFVIYRHTHKLKSIKAVRRMIEKYADAHPHDYGALAYALCSAGEPTANEKRLFNDLLVSLHAGFGMLAPTIILARFSASTRASWAKNMVAGLCGCGKAHVGACTLAMTLLKVLKTQWVNRDFEPLAREIYCKDKPFPGFGHPILNQDPRNERLLMLAKSQAQPLAYSEIYERLAAMVLRHYHLHPNIDLLAAALLLDLHISHELGTIIFLFARMPAMLAHIQEKLASPPFGISRQEAREHFAAFPKRWI